MPRGAFVRLLSTSLAAVGLSLLAGCAPPAGDSSTDAAQTADLVLVNGKIVTMDDARPEAEALAAKDGKIVAVGSRSDVEALIGETTEVLDLEGRLAVPGFIEGHAHFVGVGDAKLQLDLRPAETWGAIVDMVAEAAAAAEPGEWIRGRGWHQDKWTAAPDPAVEGFPVHDGLSAVSPENPVLLTHASGHAAFVNAKAMELAGIDGSTTPPEGGEILHDAAGRPTGLLRETAEELIYRVRSAEPTPEEMKKIVALASEECLSKGITSFQDAGSSFATIDFLKQAADEDLLGVRLWIMVLGSEEELDTKLASYRTRDYADHRLAVGGVKLWLDGALGSRGAWLLEPYDDSPGATGLNTFPLERTREIAELAAQNDYQLCIHAIGDRANREVLDIYEETFAAYPDKSDLRWRIEHAQHLHPDDIPRFAELGVIASMQAVHCTSDGPWVPDRLGAERSEQGAYVWRKLLDSGAKVVNGTDAPVEDVSPLASYYSAVTRRTKDGEVFYGGQVMDRMEALRSYTLDAAYAVFEEDVKGSLEVGKLADVTVLSRDILTVDAEEIPQTEVVYTIVGGQVAYKAEAPPRRPVATYSIVARDPATGDLGVAVQSHWFSVGSVVSWAEAGVGAVATQSFVEVSYGPLGLELMKAGKTAPEALKSLLATDPTPEVRQVAMVDRHGNVAVHTGASCITEAGHHQGEQYSVQANMMESSTVWGAMSKAFESAEGDLLDRMMAALEAAEGEGGDVRGRQSAAILIVPGTTEGAPWRERKVDLRIEDHPRPLEELARIVKVHRAYEHMNHGDELLASGDVEGALGAYASAAAIYPENVEIRYWQAVTMAEAGRLEEALPIFREVFAAEERWRVLTERLPAAGLLDPKNLERILTAAGQ